MTDSDSLRGDLDRAPRLPAANLAGYPASFTSLGAPASPLEALANEMNLGGGRACPMRAQHLLRAGMKALRGYDFSSDLQAAQAAELEVGVEEQSNDRVTELEAIRSELARVRALLRPRMEETGESFVAETVHGMLIEIENSRREAAHREERDKRRQAVAAVAEGELLCLRQQVELLRQEQARVRALAHSPDSEAETPLDVRVTAWRTWVASKNIYISADALTDGQLRRAFEAGEDESRRLTNDREDELQRALGEQAEEIETLRDEMHNHVRGILLEIAAVFGRVDDLATLPAQVRAAARAGP